MENYRSNINSFNGIPYVVTFHNINDCGTHGCALGWVPFIEELPKFNDRHLIVTANVFGLDAQSIYSELAYHWCFSDRWSPIDNTAIGISLRIQELVHNGLPSDVELQLEGMLPYMFEDHI